MIKRAASSKTTSPQVIEELLAIPTVSDAYEDARRQAALALYKLFRDSSGSERSTYAKEYLVVAAPLLNRKPKDNSAGSEQYISRCRRILEVYCSLPAELSSLLSRFLSQYPSSPRAPHLLIKRAASSKTTSPQVIEELLAIPTVSDAYEDARRQAALALYKLFRDSSGSERSTYAKEYLVVAAPLLNRKPKDNSAGSEQYISRCRRILEVSLSDEVTQLLVAKKAFTALEELEIDLSSHQDEIDYRRVQERLFSSDAASATSVTNELWTRNPNSIWSRGAQRTMFNYARQQLRNNVNLPAALKLIVQSGQRILREFEGQPDSINRSSVLAYHLAVADALMQQFKEYAIKQSAHDALILYEKVLGVRPRDGHVLRAVAQLSEESGNNERALACWRTLVAGSDPGSDSWYEAKYHLILVLAETDMKRARAVMYQLKQLNPDYGPPPWRALLAALDKRINPVKERL